VKSASVRLTVQARSWVDANRPKRPSADAEVDTWMVMPHRFVANVGGFNAATQTLKASGAFLAKRLGKHDQMKTSMKTHEGEWIGQDAVVLAETNLN
jgi:hypothetical protein